MRNPVIDSILSSSNTLVCYMLQELPGRGFFLSTLFHTQEVIALLLHSFNVHLVINSNSNSATKRQWITNTLW